MSMISDCSGRMGGGPNLLWMMVDGSGGMAMWGLKAP